MPKTDKKKKVVEEVHAEGSFGTLLKDFFAKVPKVGDLL
jgi:hypothetical protein